MKIQIIQTMDDVNEDEELQMKGDTLMLIS